MFKLKVPARAHAGPKLRLTSIFVATALFATPVTQANAFFLDPNVTEAKKHVLECTVLLFKDVINRTNNHLPECGVGENYQANGANVNGGVQTGDVPPPPAPPKPQPEPEPEDEEEEEECEYIEAKQNRVYDECVRPD